MKKQKKWLYEKWVEEHKQEEAQESISKKTGYEKDKIIVKRVSFFGKLLEVTEDVFFKFLFLLMIGMVIGLSSLGATVLINPYLREYVFNALGVPF